MDKTLIVGSPNLTGNVGSCETKNVTFSKNFFLTENIQTNSCTGEILGKNTFFDPSNLALFTALFVAVWWGFIKR